MTIYRILCDVALSFLFDSVGKLKFQAKTASEHLCLFTVSGCAVSVRLFLFTS